MNPEYMHKQITEAATNLNEKIAALGGEGLREVKPYGFGHVMSGVSSYGTPEKARKEVQKLYDEALALKEQNQAAVKHNQAVLESLFALIRKLGFSESHQERISYRSYKTRTVTHEWALSLRGLAHVGDEWPSVESSYKSTIRQIEDWERKLADEKRKADAAREADEKKKQEERIVGILADKYGLPLDSYKGDILEAVMGKNKYLRLAHYLSKNRGDWSDGTSYAEAGLSGFTVETPQDKEISDEISGYISDWCGDGRVFRDCTWSYDALFTLAKEQAPDLMADYEKIAALCSDY